MSTAAAEKQRDPGRPRSVKQEAKAAPPATEDDSDESEESDDTTSRTGRRRREVDYKALGFLRARLHTLEEALAVEDQLCHLSLLRGMPASGSLLSADALMPEQSEETGSAVSPTSSVPSSPLIDSSLPQSEVSSPLVEPPDSNDYSLGDNGAVGKGKLALYAWFPRTHLMSLRLPS